MVKSTLDLFVPSKAPSHRQQRVAQEVKFCLSQIFLRADWPVRFDEQGNVIKAPQSVTITDINVSGDLKQATIWVMPLGGYQQAETKAFLYSISGYLRKQISSHLQLRSVPALKFEIDKKIDQMSHIDELLKKI